MARPKKKTQPPPRNSKGWIVAVLLVVLVGAAAAYLLTHRGSGTEPDVATTSDTELAPITSRHLYSETADPGAEIAAALHKAAGERKRVILDFGGDWCGDCQVLDIYLHQRPNVEILDKNFVLVHVWIGHMDQHLDVAAKYGVPVEKGVPALAVLGPAGDVLYAQKSGEFEKMHEMNPASVTEFLNTWKS